MTFNKYSKFFIKNIKESFKEINKKDNLDILNNIHNYLNIDNLNNFRLNLINKMSNYKDLRKNYYFIAKDILDKLLEMN